MDRGTRTSISRRGRLRIQRRWVLVCSATSALLALVAGASPTTVSLASAFLVAIAGALIPWFASRARRATLPFALAPCFLLPSVLSVLSGAIGLAMLFLYLRQERRSRIVAAVIGGMAAQGLFRLDAASHPSPLAITIAGAACAPVVTSAIRASRRRLRRRVYGLAAAGAGVGVLLGSAALFTAFQARDAVDRALERSRSGVELLRSGERAAATMAFREASLSFEAAHRATDRPWASAARLLPVAGQNIDAIRDLTRAGHTLSHVTASALDDLDLDALGVADGRVDLALVAQLQGASQSIIDHSVDALSVVERAARGPTRGWLMPDLASRAARLRAELEENLATLRATNDVLHVAPWLLGADAPRRYLVLFTTPAEARELGGFVGEYGELTASNGALELTPRGSTGTLHAQLAAIDVSLAELPLPEFYRFQRPDHFPQNWTGTADFPTVARTAAEVIKAADGVSFDGVLLIDPYVIAALSGYSGGVDLAGVGRVTEPEDVVDFLLRGQYVAFDEEASRKALLPELASRVFDSIVDGSLPPPSRLLRDLGPLVEDRRLLFHVIDEGANRVLDRVGLTGRVEPGRLEGEETMALAVTTARANKMDAYIRREVSFEPDLRSDGSITGDVIVTTFNELPPLDRLTDTVTGDGPAFGEAEHDGKPDGTWWGFVALYSSLRLADVTDESGSSVEYDRETAYGMNYLSAVVEVPHGESASVRFRVEDAIDPERFSLRWIPYPAAVPDEITVRLGR